MEYNWKKSGRKEEVLIREKNGVPFFTFPALDQTGLTVNAFSTRLGGASKGPWSTMNLSFTRGDEKEAVMENYSRMAAALGVNKEDMVLAYQTHTTNVRSVSLEDRGKGVVRERDYRDVDGLVTDVPKVVLVTFFADCVPLYFLDPVHRAIGLSHSGWRGTVNRMGQATVERMGELYGTKAQDLIACIGPSICQECYEVGEEVAEEFQKTFGPQRENELLYPNGKPGKYQLDLWRANEIVLLEAGIRPENIHTAGICTCCNPELLYSHRKMGEKRGNLCAFLSLKLQKEQ